MTKLAQKHSIITGGGTGIGLAIAHSLGEGGAKVTIMGRNLERLRECLKDLPNAQAIQIDVTSEASVKEAMETAIANFGPCDILINNAGVASSSPFHKLKLEDWENIISVNLTGTFLCSREVFLDMKQINLLIVQKYILKKLLLKFDKS